MQEENQNTSDSWQQPTAPTQSGLPYQPVIPEQAAEPQPEPSEPMTQDFSNPTDGVMDQPDAIPQGTEDEALLRWQATEYVDHDRTVGWYVMLGVICLILVAVAVLLMKSWTFALLIPVMAVALVVYTRRPPARSTGGRTSSCSSCPASSRPAGPCIPRGSLAGCSRWGR